jgi:hypothetical protein
MYGNIVLASTKKGFVPNAIKSFTGSVFSHSLVTMPDILGIPMCIEAAEGGVDTVRFDKNYVNDPGQGYQVWKVKTSQEVKDRAIVQLLGSLETGYGFLEYPWFMWRRLNSLLGKDIKAQDNWNTSGTICSQLCVEYLKACGLGYVLIGYGRGSIAPQDLQNIFKSHPEMFELEEEVRLAA